MDIEGYILSFKEWMMAKGMSEASSIETYCSSVRTLLLAFKTEAHPKNVNQHQIIKFLGTVKSPHTRKSIYYAGKLFYDIIIHQTDKFNNIPSPDIPKSLPVILTTEEVNSIIDSKKGNIKHQAILQLMYSGALRISEPIAIKQHHISKQFEPTLNKDIARLHIVGAKGDKDRVIPLPIETYNLIELYKNKYKPVDYLFNGQNNSPQYSDRSIGEIFYQAVKFCNIKKNVKPHSLRHSRATHILDAGGSLVYLKDFLGHEDIKTTMIYTHCSSIAMARMMYSADEYIKASANRGGVVMPLQNI